MRDVTLPLLGTVQVQGVHIKRFTPCGQHVHFEQLEGQILSKAAHPVPAIPQAQRDLAALLPSFNFARHFIGNR